MSFFSCIVTGKKVQLTVKTILLCQTLKHMLEDTVKDDRNVNIPIDMKKHLYLEDVVKYCEGKDTDEAEKTGKELEDRKLAPVLYPYDEEFFQDFPKEKLFNIAQTADYLNCKPLLAITAKKIADMIKGKSRNEIKNILSLNV